MAESVPIDTREITITPVFRWETIEDINASEREGHLVKKMRRVVEVRFAGSKNYSPVFPVEAMWQRVNGRVVTYAERWAKQFQDFEDGNAQTAAGTPLEMLKGYGMSDAHLSLCRALKIYSIEALYHLEGTELKSLGMSANSLKGMANAYMADRAKGSDSAAEMEALRAEIERLKAAIPAKEASPEEIEDAVQVADDEYADLTDDQLKDRIAEKVGRKPAGNPSRTTLVQSLRELDAA
jgi:hypothetical protein